MVAWWAHHAEGARRTVSDCPNGGGAGPGSAQCRRERTLGHDGVRVEAPSPGAADRRDVCNMIGVVHTCQGFRGHYRRLDQVEGL